MHIYAKALYSVPLHRPPQDANQETLGLDTLNIRFNR